MKSKNKIEMLFIICVILLGISFTFNFFYDGFYFTEKESDINTEFEKDSLKTSYLYNFTDIEIDNTNPTMDWAYTASTYAWCSGGPGNTFLNPYLIENTFFAPGYGSNAIEIRNSDVHFRINDCGIKDVYGNFEAYAIEFDNVSNGRVVDCDLFYNKYGVYFLNSYDNWFSGNIIRSTREFNMYLENCNGTTIFNNTISNSDRNRGLIVDGNNNMISENHITNSDDDGISLSGENNQLIKNTITNNGQEGIVLNSCKNNTVSENIITRNNDGIRMGYTSNNHITENIVFNNTDSGIKLAGGATFNNISSNTVFDNTIGIDLTDWTGYEIVQYNKINLNNASNNHICGINIDNVEYNNITDNELFNCGVNVWGSTDSLITNFVSNTNLVNGKKLYYYNSTKNLSNSDFVNAGQVVLLRCNDSQASNLDLSFGTIGASLIECRNVILSDIVSNNNTGFGIYLNNCDLCEIVDSITNFNGDGGIFIQNSVNCTLQSNEANNNFFGSYYYGHDYGFGNGYGIYVHGSFNNTIQGNTASYNHEHGIRISSGRKHEISMNFADYNGDTGIYTTISDSNISSNAISGNHNNGLDVGSSQRNKIFHNIFQDHLDQGFTDSHNGILISGGSDNEVYDNTFLSYTRGVHLYMNSENNNVSDNDFSACITPIRISFQSNFNQISHNTIDSDFHGIDIYESSNNTIDSNHITSYTDGIQLGESDSNLIVNNSIDGSGHYGIDFRDSSYNTIRNNKVRNKGECFRESGDCVGNVFENNDCLETGDPVIGYGLFIIFSILGISLLLLLKERNKIKIQ